MTLKLEFYHIHKYVVTSILVTLVSSFYVPCLCMVSSRNQTVIEPSCTTTTYRIKAQGGNISPVNAVSAAKTTECPLWFVHNNVTKQCECGNELGGTVHCDHEKNRVYIIDCYCMTHDNQVGTVVGSCATNIVVRKSNTSFGSYNQLPSNITQLNEAMCGQHWNRSGRFCGRCKNNHYKSVFSYDFGCIECSDSQLKYNWIKYIAFVFVPLTVFFVLTLIIRIDATHQLPNGLVAYAQIIAMPTNVRFALAIATSYPKASPFIHIVATVYGFWNLDFLRTVLPATCLKISTLQAISLDYTTAFYPLILVVITYILIELYDNGCVMVVWMWKPFGKCLDIKSSAIIAFSAFLRLSYAKLLSVTFDLLVPVWAHNVSGKPVGVYLYYDANVVYFGNEHLPYVILAVFVMLAFIILPILLLVAYPLRFCKFLWKWPALCICLDTYQGYYKDGTEGTRDCRWFSCIYLIVRILLFAAFSFVKYTSFYLFATFICLFVTLLHVVVNPYKTKYSKYNKIHSLLTLNMAIFFMAVVCIDVTSIESVHTNTFSIIVCGFSAVIPLLYGLVHLLHHLYLCLFRYFHLRE